MKATILAGGKSSRLRPLTLELPKPMVPVANTPVMDTIISLLTSHSITDISATLMFMPHKISERYGDGSGFGVSLDWSIDERVLGTAGSVKAVKNQPAETFIVVSGDCVTNFDLRAAVEYHKTKGAEATILMTRVDVPVDFGILAIDKDGSITDFMEKPQSGEVFTNQINTGIYVLEPSVLDLIPPGIAYDFALDLFPEMLRLNRKVCGFHAYGYWSDIGTLDSYSRTNFDLIKGIMPFRLQGTEIQPKVFVGVNTLIDSTAVLKGPILIGSNCRIGPGAIIEGPCILGDNTVIEGSATVSQSVLWKGCRIDRASEVRGSILGNRVHLMHNVRISENTAAGDEVVVGEYASLGTNVFLSPWKVVKPHSIIEAGVIF